MIEVNDLRKTYTTYERGHTLLDAVKSLVHRKEVEVEAVKGLSFRVEQGEMIGFLGPNGAGKSTTLKMLTGVLHPTSGEARVLGYVPWKQRKSYVARIGAVFGQKSQLLWDIPPLDAFHMNKAIYGLTEADFRTALNDLVDLLDVGAVMRKPTRQLSLGERMKCEFIMAMLHRPEIVFLDEPTIGLDVIAKENIRSFIKRMNEQGVTFVLTTHDLGDVEQLAKRVMVVNHGEIIFDDGIGALKGMLGDKKIVRLVAASPLADALGPGVALLEQKSSHEVKLEIDTAVVSLNAFLQNCSASTVIVDMAIEEVPIERAIKVLYG
ncbi:ATP-binding cassette domain-containing protein [Paenibacillus sp. R14(2021)]|uniref:ABC transporter ATP-binding protein n=1 Tax=Paenibacillus sp. R14(2021) TaxID=2859228 RepID=UPI001C614C33|nr:ATP-binding cassette domain-containing protein [Paenibacillus sp. R14(2021)]